ncbi:MAG: extracellular solute-binding protein, partial [Gammaproteobacteria bacterium]|nr:extracellular solute-binding protein [Gammaproteobacteria bacterium]
MKKLLLVMLISLLISSIGMTGMAKVNLNYFTHTSISVEGLQPGEYEQKVIAEFEKLYPDVHIDFEVVPYLGDQGKLQFQIAAGNSPDILAGDITKVASYVDAGLLLDFDDVIDKTSFYDFAVEASSINGKMYYYPMGLRPGSFMISRTIARNFGIEDMLLLEGDRVITTKLFEEMIAKANANAKDDKTYAVYINFADTVSWSHWFAMLIGS